MPFPQTIQFRWLGGTGTNNRGKLSSEFVAFILAAAQNGHSSAMTMMASVSISQPLGKPET